MSNTLAAAPNASADPQPPAWSRWHTAGLLLIVVAIGVLGVATPSLNLGKLVSW
jgi:hypothetical protein